MSKTIKVVFFVILDLIILSSFIGCTPGELTNSEPTIKVQEDSNDKSYVKNENVESRANPDVGPARVTMRMSKLYFESIRQRVLRSWIKQTDGKWPGKVDCTVSVLQTVRGEVLKVVAEKCKNGSPALRKQVESAVRSASPLPRPPDPKLFDRHVRFYFRAGDD